MNVLSFGIVIFISTFDPSWLETWTSKNPEEIKKLELQAKETALTIAVDAFEKVADITKGIIDQLQLVLDNVIIEMENYQKELPEEIKTVLTEKVEEVKPVEKPVVIEDDNYVWLLHGKACTTKVVFQLLQHRTNLPDNQIVSALNVVKNNMEKLGKTTCEIKEEEDTFDFVILK